MWTYEAFFNRHAILQPLSDINPTLHVNYPNCGYVLKPQHLRTPGAPIVNRYNSLTVRVFSARQLPKIGSDVIDPYIELHVRGMKDMHTTKTQVERNNGFCPEWDETFEFNINESSTACLYFGKCSSTMDIASMY